MSEPLDTRTLRHFLDFKTDETGLIEIDEPIGFDAANFVIEQREYGRDISFAGGETEFIFSSQENKYGHQFERLLEYDKLYGFESDVDYVLREGAIDYIVGQVDFSTKNTDEFRDFSCAIIQSSEQAILERRSDVKVNLFSDTSLDDDTIAPVSTERILLKSKPVYQISAYTSILNEERNFLIINNNAVNFSQNIVAFGIDDTLTWIDTLNSSIFDFKLIQAQSTLTEVEIEITNMDLRITDVQNGNGNLRLRVVVADESFNVFSEYTFDTIGNGESFDETYSYQVPLVPNGFGLFLAVEQLGDGVIGFTRGWDTNLRATSTFIDSVVEGVRLIDAIDKVKESIDNTFTLDAPRFQKGGEWYDNFVFSGNMLRGRNTFTLDFEMIKNHLPEFHSDYEVDGKNLFIGKYDDFYTSNEIGAFLINPNAEFNISFNERHTINTFSFNYKSFDQDRFNENTIDAVHTETQWLLPNKLVENSKEVTCEFVRDPYLLENTRRKAFEETTASVQEDDEVFIVDVALLPDNPFNGFTALLNHQWDSVEEELKLLNDGSFNWSILGFEVGDDFFITPTNNPEIDPNQGAYTVLEVERTLLTLSLNGTNLNPQSGEFVSAVTYPLTDVRYVTRTTEGFDLITGLINDDRYGNLLYTPKRNILNNYGSYLRTCVKFREEDIINTSFKNWTDDPNPLVTQFDGGVVVDEIANIAKADLPSAILTPRIINTKVLCDFSTYLDYATKLKTERGFVRVYDNEGRVLKGFVKNSDFLWAENSLTLTLEEKQESDITVISYKNGMYYIDEVGYPEDIVTDLEWKITDNKYVQFFDSAWRPLTNKLLLVNVVWDIPGGSPFSGATGNFSPNTQIFSNLAQSGVANYIGQSVEAVELIDTGFGTSWVTITNDPLTTTRTVEFDIDENTGDARTVIIRIEDVDFTIYQQVETITADNDTLTSDNTTITSDNG